MPEVRSVSLPQARWEDLTEEQRQRWEAFHQWLDAVPGRRERLLHGPLPSERAREKRTQEHKAPKPPKARG